MTPRTSFVLVLLVPLLALGCKRAERASGPSGPVFPELDAQSPAPATLLSGAPAARPPFKARMKDHALHGMAIRDAIARGDLAGAKSSGRLLADTPKTVTTEPEPGLEPELDAMAAAARRISDAQDIDEGAARLGALAETCGRCHSEFGGPRLGITDPPPDTRDVAGRMARHQWAATRLWEGLVAPSSDLWMRGARVLEDAPLEPEGLTPGKSPVAKVGLLAKTVHELGHRATTAETSARRSELYGSIMSTCGSCHAWLGGGTRGPK